jgi:hypothetical protein
MGRGRNDDSRAERKYIGIRESHVGKLRFGEETQGKIRRHDWERER